uniref:NAD-dependent epimerase/dehydratase family protein n=1 Tax=Polaribacter sp. TaxID=1920175 RepID=UPI004048DC8A
MHQELFNKVEHLVGDRNNDLSALENRAWDVVIDNSGQRVQWTEATANLLKNKVKLYLYTSSTGVYYPYLNKNISEDTKTLTKEPETFNHESEKLEYWYGVMKTNSEAAAKKAFGEERTIIVRPTYMFGPGDLTNRFIHWPVRLARGGEILVPGKKEDPVQYIDVRDVAEFMIRLAESSLTGTYNAVGPKVQQTMLDFVKEAATAFPTKNNYVLIDDYDFLESNGISDLVPWIMPIGNNYGSSRASVEKGVESGLSYRPLKTSIKEMHDWWVSNSLTEKQRNKFEKDPKGVLQNELKIIQKWKETKN